MVMSGSGARRLPISDAPGPVPSGLGYVRLPSGSREPAEVVVDGVALMEAFAQRCGYDLGEVFVDDEPPLRLGWASLVHAVRVARPVSVLVPDVPGLRLPVAELELLRARLRYVTSAPLVVARPEVAWGVRGAAAALAAAPGAGAVRVPRAGARSWPFAVGLIQAGEGLPAGEGSAGRLAVAVAAYHAGFYLVDVVEADARTGVTAGDVAWLWSLSVRADAEAVFILGLEGGGRAGCQLLAGQYDHLIHG
jgi:hypothetical protein